MRYFKITNRETRNAQTLTELELTTFFKKNNVRNYAVSQTLSPKDKNYNDVLDTLAISCFALAFIILITEIVRDNFTIL